MNADPTGFEDAWADIYWTFAHDDMAFDYRDRYFTRNVILKSEGMALLILRN